MASTLNQLTNERQSLQQYIKQLESQQTGVSRDKEHDARVRLLTILSFYGIFATKNVPKYGRGALRSPGK